MVFLNQLACRGPEDRCQNCEVERFGAILRTDTTQKVIHLVFTGHDFADGSETIRQVARKYGIKFSFFLTVDYHRNPAARESILALKNDGHYLGPHSGKHLLYCSWGNRDSTLVSRKQFIDDLNDNYQAMAPFGIKRKEAGFFLPAYEWYNKDIYEWASKMGIRLVNFTPGTSSNQDWTYPEPGKTYINSDTIYRRILNYEKRKGMNGFILLVHIGVDPRRPDKFYDRLDALVGELVSRGYRFTRIDR